MSVELSVVITAHNEGALLHKMILSAEQALAKTKVDYEIILSVDNGDKKTNEYVERYEEVERFRIIRHKFGDAGESRNAATKVANGTFVAFLDADDLVSQNYFEVMLPMLREGGEKMVVHPEYCLTFFEHWGQFIIQVMKETGPKERNKQILFGRNRWIAPVAGRKEIFLDTPYMRDGKGFGHEDYTLNIQLSEKEIEHKIAKGTVYFYRRRANSRVDKNNTALTTQPYSELFAVSAWRKMPLAEEVDNVAGKKSAKARARDFYVRLRNNRKINKIITPMAELAKKVTGKKLVPIKTLPEDLLREWTNMEELEPLLRATDAARENIARYDSDTDGAKISEAYLKLCHQVKSKPDSILMIPGELVDSGIVLNQLRVIREEHPDWKIAVITTTPIDNAEYKLPDTAYTVEYGDAAKELHDLDREILLTRLLIQLQCKRLHIVHSDYAYQWMSEHRELVESQFEVCVSILRREHGRWSEYLDFNHAQLVELEYLIEKIFTDDAKLERQLVDLDGIDKTKVSCY